MATSFDEMEDFFLAGITDDMYLELTEEDTKQILDEILLAALPSFEFPKNKNLLEKKKDFSESWRIVLLESTVIAQFRR